LSSSEREASSASPTPVPGDVDLDRTRVHFAGIGGSGMSALAQYLAMRGGTVTGSDRDFDRGGRAHIRACLERLGVRVYPQDGSGVEAGCAAVVASTAVESRIPDIAAARAAAVPVWHRSALLAHFAGERRTVAVAGSSGKSTVVAMIFEILRAAGREPSVLTGGNLLVLADAGYLGNAWVGESDLLVIEADESDGSLVNYSPAIGVLLNLHRDHKEPAELFELFRTFRDQTGETCVIGEDPALAPLRRPGDCIFGCGPEATLRAAEVELGGSASRFELAGQGAAASFQLPLPGRHNVHNALAAVAATAALGVEPPLMQAALAAYRGVGRRFQRVGAERGIEVIDDFAHNPRKIAATLETAARRSSGRILAVYQPHGFGPTRFLREELVETFSECLRPADQLWLLDIYDAGGTAQRDLSSADLVADLATRGRPAALAGDRAALPGLLAAEAADGDLVLVMGARDPSLTDLCRAILAALA
jgi:UDP-N-acetylmuramate--alanine ligase